MNRIVMITGASSGIGEACAEEFARNGDHLILTGRRKDRLDIIKDSIIERYRVRVHVLVFDVQVKKEVFASVDSIPPEWQAIDILVNNAGLALGRDYFDEADIEDWETMLNTNVYGLIYVSKAVLPFMTARKRGHIINIGSVAAKEIYEKGNAYCASKAAVDALSKSMRIDLLQHHIKVTAIHPGAVLTEFGEVRFKGDKDKAMKVYDGFAPLAASDVAGAIIYCCNLPENVCINDLVITCTRQANAIYFNRES